MLGRACSLLDNPLRRLPRAGAQRRTRRQRARTHPESRAKRWRNITQRITAARAAAFFAESARGVGAQPVASRFALRIDALHGEARQKLHVVSLGGRRSFAAPARWRGPDSPSYGRLRKPTPDKWTSLLARILAHGTSAVKDKYHNILWPRCSGPLAHSMPPGTMKGSKRRPRST